MSNDFFKDISRIADALEVIAKTMYHGARPVVDPLAEAEKRKAEAAERDSVIAELESLKIPYATEMPTDRLKLHLTERRDQAKAKLEADAKAKTPADDAAAKAAKAKKDADAKAAKAKKDADDAAAKAKTTPTSRPLNEAELEQIKQVIGRATAELGKDEAGTDVVVTLFTQYPFSSPVKKARDINAADLPAFIAHLEKAMSDKAASSSADNGGLF